MKTEARCIEAVLMVADYNGSFDDCKAATDDAEDQITTMLQRDESLMSFAVTSVKFIEFDSSNPSHAGAYFEVKVHCEKFDDEATKKELSVYQDGADFYNDKTGDELFTSCIVVGDSDTVSAGYAREEFEEWFAREYPYSTIKWV